MVIFAAIAFSVIVIVVIISLIFYFRHQKIKNLQRGYVICHSVKLKKLKEINNSYKFNNPSERDLLYRFFLKSKRAFDNFDLLGAVQTTFIDKKFEIKSLVEKVTKDRNLLKQYKNEIQNLPSTEYESLPENKYMNSSLFYKIENEYVRKNYLTVNTDLTICFLWSYTSPAGRNSYRNKKTFNYDQVISLYFKFFSVDLRKIEENERTALVVKEVTKKMNKKIYSVDEIIALYKEHGFAANESDAELTLNKLGYYKKRGTEYYIHISIKSVRDLILSSSDENGLILYDNKMKNQEYDNTISKLEKEGWIIPINSLSFLKVDKNLNYRGITMEDIDRFESLLLEYSKRNKFFSLKQIITDIKCIVTEIDFDECFVYSIVKNCGFIFEVPGLNKMFTGIEKPQRIMYLEWLLNDKKSVDAYDLVYDLKETYGIEYSIYSIIYDIEKCETELYYNAEMEKIYSKKDYFFDELEGVL